MAGNTIPFPAGARVLFQGDSITDGNRGRSDDPNHILGHGYVFIIAARHGCELAGREVVFINRGISGNKVSDLIKRWQVDAIDLKPDVLSILIGVNDLNANVSAADYERQYAELLAQTKQALPNTMLVLMEPFGLPTGKKKDGWDVYSGELKKRREIAARLALKHGAIFVPLQKAFEDSTSRAAGEHWIWDGVHPTYSGQQLIADEWVRVVNGACEIAVRGS